MTRTYRNIRYTSLPPVVDHRLADVGADGVLGPLREVDVVAAGDRSDAEHRLAREDDQLRASEVQLLRERVEVVVQPGLVGWHPRAEMVVVGSSHAGRTHNCGTDNNSETLQDPCQNVHAADGSIRSTSSPTTSFGRIDQSIVSAPTPSTRPDLTGFAMPPYRIGDTLSQHRGRHDDKGLYPSHIRLERPAHGRSAYNSIPPLYRLEGSGCKSTCKQFRGGAAA